MIVTVVSVIFGALLAGLELRSQRRQPVPLDSQKLEPVVPILEFTHSKRSTIRYIDIEPWGMSFDLFVSCELRVSASDESWDVEVHGETLTLFSVGSSTRFVVEQKRGTEWVEVWNG